MGRLVTRRDVGFLAIWEAIMVPLAVFGPSDGTAGFVAVIAGGVLAGLLSRRVFGRRRPAVCSSTPFWLMFAVGVGVMIVALVGLRLVGASGYGALGIALGVYLTADAILDRWWSGRGPGPTGTRVTPV